MYSVYHIALFNYFLRAFTRALCTLLTRGVGSCIDEQYGFRPGRLAVTNLMVLNIPKASENKY